MYASQVKGVRQRKGRHEGRAVVRTGGAAWSREEGSRRIDLARQQGSSRAMAQSEQRELLAALAAYAVALTRIGHPVPYRMRSELAMYRAMFDPTRRRN